MSDEILEALSQIGVQRLRALNYPAVRMKVSDLQYLNISFGIYGEDLAIAHLLKEKLKSGVPGFYLDIGCFDPRAASNSYLFYAFGWNGICVDANPEFAEAYRQVRPRDRFINAAVGTGSAPMFFHRHTSNTGKSYTGARQDGAASEYEVAVTVPQRALRDILREHVPAGAAIDFATIDIEGGELECLRSNDWDSYRPRVLMIETHGIDLDRPQDYPAVQYLLTQGYRYRGAIGENSLLVG